MQWVLVEGGVVQETSPGVSIFDLDFLKADTVTPYEVEDAQYMLAEMQDYAGDTLDIDIERVQDWIEKHKHLLDEES
jgi:hypothetical protein